MNIRVLTSDDIPAVAAIHRAVFPHAAISRLGQGAAKKYYRLLISGLPGLVGLGAFEQNQLAAFCIVGSQQVTEASFVRRHVPFIAWRVATHPWLLVEPFIWSRIGSGLRLLLPHPPSSVAPAATRRNADASYAIQHIAVHPGYQGRGLGRQLLIASENLARERGCAEMHLSVYLDNAQAIGLYERMGWQKDFQDGAWRGFMFKRLGCPAGEVQSNR